jgi:2-keto-4-pentenoate hydratase
MDQQARRILAAAIVEAIETGNPIAPLPPGLRPVDTATGEAIAQEVLDALALAPCGLRCVVQPDGALRFGPMLESRLLRDGATVPLAALRHARVSAAAIGVLGEALDPATQGPPVLAAVHPAIDIATSRLRDGATGAAEEAADLGGLGHVAAGPRAAPPGSPTAVSCAADPKRPRGLPIDLAAAFAEAAVAACRLGGLPAGALLVVAGLTPGAVPGHGQHWTARLAGLGRARIRFAEA